MQSSLMMRPGLLTGSDPMALLKALRFELVGHDSLTGEPLNMVGNSRKAALEAERPKVDRAFWES
jgi:hypothetical protein